MKDTCATLCPDKVIIFHSFSLTSHRSASGEYLLSGSLSRIQRSAEPSPCGQRQPGRPRLITEQQCRGFLGISDSCHNLNVVRRKKKRKKERLQFLHTFSNIFISHQYQNQVFIIHELFFNVDAKHAKLEQYGSSSIKKTTSMYKEHYYTFNLDVQVAE